MKSFPEIDLLKSTLDQHRPLNPAIGRNLREDLIVRWTYHSNARNKSKLAAGAEGDLIG